MVCVTYLFRVLIFLHCIFSITVPLDLCEFLQTFLEMDVKIELMVN